MNEEIKKRLDRLFDEIEKLRKQADLFHVTGKSDFTKDIEELRGMHESVVRDYKDYQTSGKRDLDQFKTSMMTNSDAVEERINMVKKNYGERKK